jgi:hypothetical protein
MASIDDAIIKAAKTRNKLAWATDREENGYLELFEP